MPELLIRPSVGDHKVLADLMAPGLARSRRPIDRLVLNAQDIARSNALVDAAKRSGTPVIIDPLTMLLQGPIEPQDPWVQHVPFVQTDPVADTLLTNPFWLDDLVSKAVEFQVDRGRLRSSPPTSTPTTRGRPRSRPRWQRSAGRRGGCAPTASPSR